MTIRKLVLFFIIGSFALKAQLNAQSCNFVISLNEVRVPGTITTGTYSQLVESLGYPKSRFFSTINPISHRCLNEGMSIAPKSNVQCEYLEYDAYEYIRIGDSVQLVFVDIEKALTPIYIGDITISSKKSQKVFLSEMTRKGLWSEELSQYKVGEIEFHYYTHSKVKNFCVDFKEDPCSSVVFTFHDSFLNKNIWWIEFPIMRIDGIVH